MMGAAPWAVAAAAVMAACLVAPVGAVNSQPGGKFEVEINGKIYILMQKGDETTTNGAILTDEYGYEVVVDLTKCGDPRNVTNATGCSLDVPQYHLPSGALNPSALLTLDAYLLLPNVIVQNLLNNFTLLDKVVNEVSYKLDVYLNMNQTAQEVWLQSEGIPTLAQFIAFVTDLIRNHGHTELVRINSTVDTEWLIGSSSVCAGMSRVERQQSPNALCSQGLLNNLFSNVESDHGSVVGTAVSVGLGGRTQADALAENASAPAPVSSPPPTPPPTGVCNGQADPAECFALECSSFSESCPAKCGNCPPPPPMSASPTAPTSSPTPPTLAPTAAPSSPSIAPTQCSERSDDPAACSTLDCSVFYASCPRTCICSNAPTAAPTEEPTEAPSSDRRARRADPRVNNGTDHGHRVRRTTGSSFSSSICTPNQRFHADGIVGGSNPSGSYIPYYDQWLFDDKGPSSNSEADYRIRHQLVIPMRFSDHRFRSVPSQKHLDEFFNCRSGSGCDAHSATTSVRDYFLENSYMRSDLISTVVDWVDLSMSESYIANNQYGLSNSYLCMAMYDALDVVVQRDTGLDWRQFAHDCGGHNRVQPTLRVHDAGSGYVAGTYAVTCSANQEDSTQVCADSAITVTIEVNHHGSISRATFNGDASNYRHGNILDVSGGTGGQVRVISFTNTDANYVTIEDVIFITSGYPAEFASSSSAYKIWSHRWSVGAMCSYPPRSEVRAAGSGTYSDAYYNGGWIYTTASHGVNVNFKISNYMVTNGCFGDGGDGDSCSDKLRIGVVAHEMGHGNLQGSSGVNGNILDMYETGSSNPLPSRCGSSGSGSGIDKWGLMGDSWGACSDQRYPPAMTAHSKYKLGWITPIDISDTNQAEDVQLYPSFQCPDALKIGNGTYANDGEYLFIENKQHGGHDSGAPGTGILVLHIDESLGYRSNRQPTWTSSSGNGGDTYAHYYKRVEQADGADSLECGGSAGGSDIWSPGSTLTSAQRSNSQLATNEGYSNFVAYRTDFQITNAYNSTVDPRAIQVKYIPNAASSTSPTVKNVRRTTCAAGQFYSPSSSGCESCPIGKYSEAGYTMCNSGCQVCPDGKYSDTEGATTCTDCPAGKYDDVAVYPSDSHSCRACPTASTLATMQFPLKWAAEEKCTGNVEQSSVSYKGGAYWTWTSWSIDCGEWTFLGLTMDEWYMVMYGAIAFVVLLVIISHFHSRQMQKKHAARYKQYEQRKVRVGHGYGAYHETTDYHHGGRTAPPAPAQGQKGWGIRSQQIAIARKQQQQQQQQLARMSPQQRQHFLMQQRQQRFQSEQQLRIAQMPPQQREQYLQRLNHMTPQQKHAFWQQQQQQQGLQSGYVTQRDANMQRQRMMHQQQHAPPPSYHAPHNGVRTAPQHSSEDL